MDKKISEFKKELDAMLAKQYGLSWPLVRTWWNIQDWYDGSILYDIKWWIFNGQPEWRDAVKCDKFICCKCGNKPFGKQ